MPRPAPCWRSTPSSFLGIGERTGNIPLKTIVFKYARLRGFVAYDPLDGSSLVDVNFSIGSIFGIYENELTPQNLKAAAYVVYGPRLELVLVMPGPDFPTGATIMGSDGIREAYSTGRESLK